MSEIETWCCIVVFCFWCLQCGNPILKFVRNVPWEFGEIIPDYQLSSTSCALYLRSVIGRGCCFTQCMQLSCLSVLHVNWLPVDCQEVGSAWVSLSLVGDAQVKVCSRETHSPSWASKITLNLTILFFRNICKYLLP